MIGLTIDDPTFVPTLPCCGRPQPFDALVTVEDEDCEPRGTLFCPDCAVVWFVLCLFIYW